MTALTKADLALYLMQRIGLNNRDAKAVVEAFFEDICTALSKGHDVKLSGFGSFALRQKRARLGRNPKTGEDKIISARKVVSFRPGQKLRVRINQVTIISSNIAAD